MLDAIELGMTLKFPDHVAAVMEAVADIKDPDTLKKITQALKTARDVAEILYLARKP